MHRLSAALALLQEAYARSEAPGQQLALLTDRVRVNEGKKQLYGTQTMIENDTVAFQPIEDPAHLDARRAAMGLMPLEQYAKMLGDTYQVEVRMP